ncbi:MAG: hypothetical protein U1E65_25165 [Myxococcota bacterium]
MSNRVLIVSVALAAFACEKQHEKAPPPPPTTTAPVAAAQPHGAASQPAGQPAAAAPAGDPVQGEIRLPANVGADAVKETDILFITARQRMEGGKAGMIVAVQRHAKPTFPFKFTLSASDVMIQGTPFTGPFVIRAALDDDGDALTRNAKHDLIAETADAVNPGQTGLVINLAPVTEVPTPGAAAPPSQPAQK